MCLERSLIRQDEQGERGRRKRRNFRQNGRPRLGRRVRGETSSLTISLVAVLYDPPQLLRIYYDPASISCNALVTIKSV